MTNPHGTVVGMGGLLDQARTHLASGGSVLLTGPAGIGKSTLLTTLAGELGGRRRLLRCSLSEAESHLPFLGLIDLLAETGADVLETLPPHQRAVLDAALLRRTDPAGERDILTLRMAVLAAFRALCAARPVLLVIDEVQWLDRPSVELLGFVARRAEGLPLSTVAAIRTGPAGEQEEVTCCPPPVLTLRVPSMTVAEIAQLLADRAGLRLPRPVAVKIHATSGGNPFFALELGRALADRTEPLDPTEPLPVPDSLRTLMLDRYRALSARAHQTLLTASAAARPTVSLLTGAGRADAAADLIEAAREGIIEPGAGETVRFTHPLLSAVLYAEAPQQARLGAHATLAQTVTDPVERARHLALATPGPDAQVAAILSEAATAARRRGAPATAARLGLLAADHTPAEDWPAEADRRLTAAECSVVAAEFAMARGVAYDVLGRSTHAAERVRAWMVILDSCGQAMAEVDNVFPQALADARDDPALLAPLHYQLAWRAMMVEGSAVHAQAEATLAAALAAEANDRSTEILALTKQALVELHMGHPDAERTLTRALAEPQDPQISGDHNGPVYAKARWSYLLHDRLDDSHRELRALTHVVRQRGSVESLVACLHGQAQIEVYRGRCERALDLAYQCLHLTEDTGLSLGPALCLVAFAEAAGGCLDRALATAERGVRHTEDDGDLLYLPRNLHAQGHVQLLMGNPAAAETLRRVRDLEQRQGMANPAIRRWHADLAEALAQAGAADEAVAVIEETRARAARLGQRSILAALDRAASLVTAAHGDLGAAAAGLSRAATTLAGLPFPLEEGRAWLALGRVQLRRGDAPAARSAFREAQRIFARASARPWIAVVAAELERLELGIPVPPEGGGANGDPLSALTGVERKVAALVADGSTNQEIAARLFVSVKTVEAALTRTYRKLGVRSRVDLARLAAAWRATTGTRD